MAGVQEHAIFDTDPLLLQGPPVSGAGMFLCGFQIPDSSCCEYPFSISARHVCSKTLVMAACKCCGVLSTAGVEQIAEAGCSHSVQ